ncbi:MAG: tripartite tricarboxylate transporter TctB family protein [Burkholderiaceae bacterium]
MKFNDALSGAALLALALAILFNVQSFPNIPGQNIGPGAFPGLLASFLALCAVLLIHRGWRESGPRHWVVLGNWIQSRYHLRNFLITIGCLLFYILASERVGFIPCAMAILITMFWALQVRTRLILPIAILVTLVIHTIFYKGLRVPLPWGLLMPLQW